MASIANVLAIVHERFPQLGDPKAATRKDRALATSLIRLLESHQADDLEVELDGEELLDFDDHEADPDYHSSEEDDEPRSSTDPVIGKCVQFSGGKMIDVVRVQEAADDYKSTQKGSRVPTSIGSRFRFIKTDSDLKKLRDFIRDKEAALSRRKKLQDLHCLLFDELKQKLADGIPLHDVNLGAMALTINQELKIKNFKASPRWIAYFKRAHNIVSRRITKFVSRRTQRNREATEAAAREFVAEIQSLGLAPSKMVNADQSGFTIEMLSARTLAIKGTRHVECAVQAVSSLTHSYTVMPIVSAEGCLAPKLFVVLKEKDGKFPDDFDRDAFPNLVVRSHTSHIMTKNLMKEWLQTCLLNLEFAGDLLLLVDSWSSFKDHDTIQALVPDGKKLRIRNIPPGATSFIQPLDVYFFRVFKGFMKRLHNHVLACSLPFVLAQRANILRVLEVVWNQFSNPMFGPFLRYSWRKIGYIDASDEDFKTPVEVCFKRCSVGTLCQILDCSQAAFLCCSYCNNQLCFDHFVVNRHYHPA